MKTLKTMTGRRRLPHVLLLLLLLLLPNAAAARERPLLLSHDCGAACVRPQSADPATLQAEAMLEPFRADPQQQPWDHYRLHLTLEPAQQRVSGALRIVHTNRATRSYATVWLHAYPNHPDVQGSLRITAVYLDGRPADRIVRDNAVLVGLPLAAPLAPGDSVVIDLGFVTQTPLNASRTAFGAFNREAGVWALGTFYPILARCDQDGRWDTRPVNSLGDYAVSSTALYDVTVNTPPDWQPVATSTPLGPVTTYADRQVQRFVSGPQREFFLAALQGLEELRVEVDGTLVSSFVRPGAPAAAARSLQTAADALRIFNRRFGPYPFRRLIVIEAALTRFYGMEYPGVVLIDSGLYQRNNQRFETTIAHEVAHQWWFGLVGSDAQSEPWIDEGFASYSEVIYYRETGRPEQAEAQLADFRRSWAAVRDGGRDAALTAPLAELRGRYVAVAYSKAALFVDALERELGAETFDRFLRGYVAAARYTDSDTAALLNSAEQACSCDLQPFAAPWFAAVP
jgi:aminopeptidase N